jgi:hypothetical protein
MTIRDCCRTCVFTLLLCVRVAASEHHGQVRFGGLPVPGATVSVSQGEKKFTTVTDPQGGYSFLELGDGIWAAEVEMPGFSRLQRDVEGGASVGWDLQMLRLEEMNAQAATATTAAAQTRFQSTDLKSAVASTDGQPSSAAALAGASEPIEEAGSAELNRRAADGLLINGTANNASASLFSLASAFGNNRRGTRPLYTGNLGLILDNSALNARPFSLTGQDTPRPDYNRMQGVAAFGGPLRIPHLVRNGPNVILTYQWTRNRNASTQTGLMPGLAERGGDFSRSPNVIFDPTNGLPFPGNRIPANRISPQAKALLTLYPLPNFDNSARYNYQVPVLGATHQDDLQSRWNQTLPRRNQLSGNLAYLNTRTDSPNVFGFLDSIHSAGINAGVNWVHTFHPRLYTVVGTQFSRLVSRTTPFFTNRVNISREAGISGNNQDPLNWGPPALNFSGGITGLSDAQYAWSRMQTSGVSLEVGYSRGRHNFRIGGDFRRHQLNLLSQEDPRGTFTFNGASGTGSDFAGFLLGIPDTSSIAFGNADKYFRSSSGDAFIADDWRIRPGFSLNAGLRWEYGSPVHERYGRLVNLDLAPGYSAAVPVVAAESPASLIRADRNNLAPRVAFAWKPLPASSMVVRGGYGIYYDTSVYQPIATLMAQQSPLSTSLRVENSAANPLTLARGFNAQSSGTRNTFAVDPDFRVGYSHNWQLSLQRDLPASLVMIATYAGIKGTRAQQQYLPNTYPDGAVDPCPSCPAGFSYLTSNGNSTRQSGSIELRRRLRAGFTATALYTFSKSIDNAALGGRNQGVLLLAQNWLDLRAERALSSFDQRHLLTTTVQYTTGVGLGGGALLSGWRGRALKEWTFSSQITAGTGLPLTPIFPGAVRGTGVNGVMRPDYTGAPLYDAPSGFFLNPSAYASPVAGRWGNAGRNSITGPSQFTLNASVARNFRINDRFSFDLRLDAMNALNRPVFPSWNTTATSAQFGLPNPANPMRSIQTTMRVRF